MKTILFVERTENKGKMIVDYRLTNSNYFIAPQGLIRIARFENCFWPAINEGYYGDIYMKNFIRKWKKVTYENKQRKNDKMLFNNLLESKNCDDINNIILEFL